MPRLLSRFAHLFLPSLRSVSVRSPRGLSAFALLLLGVFLAKPVEASRGAASWWRTPLGLTVAYDGQNRLQTATTDSGGADPKTTTYAYEPDDLLKTVSYPNGVVATPEYDRADRLTSLRNGKEGQPPTSAYTYEYDPNGNRTKQVETNGLPAPTTEETTYSYDALNRLASVNYPDKKVGYGYDAVGNRTSEVERDLTENVLSSKLASFDAVNRLSSIVDSVAPANNTALTWDPNGNQLTKTTGGTTTEYRYDVRDKLVEVGRGGSILGRFQYDFSGRRNKKIGEERFAGHNGIVQYVYDQMSTLLELDGTGETIAKYDYGSDRLISLTHRNEGRRYFHLDGLTSVVSLTDDFGDAKAAYHLDAWGGFRVPAELGASKNRFGLSSHLFDPETKLYLAATRFYDPVLGRFTTQDSFLGTIDNPPSLHRYFYANDNPLRYIDVTGHWPIRQEISWFARTAAATLGGYAVGVAKVATAPVIFVFSTAYNVTGGIAYAATGRQEFRGQYQALERAGKVIDRVVESPTGARDVAIETVAAPVSQAVEAFKRGDAYGTGEGIGLVAGQVATAAEGIQAGASKLSNIRPSGGAFATETGLVLQGGGTAAATGGPGLSVPAGILLSSNVNDALTIKEGADRERAAKAPGAGHEAPPNTTTEPAKAPKSGAAGTTRLRDPETGRFVSDPANPPSPHNFTDAQRRAAWKSMAEDPNSPLTDLQRQEIRERGWRGPQQKNPQTGEMETMELSHEPVPLREGGTEVVPRWPDEHAAVDPFRRLKEQQ